MIVPGNAILSALILFAIAMPFLYAARRLMHDFFRSVGNAIGGPLRLEPAGCSQRERHARAQQDSPAPARARASGQLIEREFERISALVTRDLEGYPALQRKLLEEITKVEEDYKKCGEVPPPPPSWTEAVTAIVRVKSEGNEMVQKDPRGDQALRPDDPRQSHIRIPPSLRVAP